MPCSVERSLDVQAQQGLLEAHELPKMGFAPLDTAFVLANSENQSWAETDTPLHQGRSDEATELGPLD